MKNIQFIGTTPEELKKEIAAGIDEKLQAFLEQFRPKQPNDYLTRKEVAEMLNVDLSTIHNWCKKGKLKPYGIGARIYFLRSEVESCLIPINRIGYEE